MAILGCSGSVPPGFCCPQVAAEVLGVAAIHAGNFEPGVTLAGAAGLREVAGGGAPRAVITFDEPLELVQPMLGRRDDRRLVARGKSDEARRRHCTDAGTTLIRSCTRASEAV